MLAEYLRFLLSTMNNEYTLLRNDISWAKLIKKRYNDINWSKKIERERRLETWI